MANVIDRGFEAKVMKAGMVEIPLEEAQDLLRAAVGKATDQAVPDGEARAIAARTYHLAQAFNRALAVGDEDLSSFPVDEELVKAIRQDVEGAEIVESVSEAMTRLAERLGTQKETAVATASPQAAAAPPPPPAPEEPSQEAQAEPTATEEPAQAQESTATAQVGPDTGGQPPTAQEETHWPADLNTPADPDGLDDWGRDPQ